MAISVSGQALIQPSATFSHGALVSTQPIRLGGCSGAQDIIDGAGAGPSPRALGPLDPATRHYRSGLLRTAEALQNHCSLQQVGYYPLSLQLVCFRCMCWPTGCSLRLSRLHAGCEARAYEEDRQSKGKRNPVNTAAGRPSRDPG